MKSLMGILILTAAVPAFSAVPTTALQCANPRTPLNREELNAMPVPNPGAWECMNLGALSKTDLAGLAGKASLLRVRTLNSGLNKRDLIELDQQTPVLAEINSRAYNRIDVQDLQRGGVTVLIQTAEPVMNINDYLEIARTGPVSIEVNSPAFTKAQALELARIPGTQLIFQGNSGLSAQDIQEVLAASPISRTRLQ